MKDSYNREIDYLRISLTDKCNLRCKYCIPPDGVEYISHKDILSLEEIARVVELLAKLGIKRVRLTGGEPLVRKNFCKLISDIRSTDGIEKLSITTNGTMLKDNIEKMVKAGIDDVNISLDTLDKEVYKELTGKDMLDDVLEGIDLALKYNLNPKINCVPMKEWNEKELIDLAALARERGLDVRFIELMPTSCGKKYTGISNEKVKKKIESEFGELKPIENISLQAGPSSYYEIEGFKGRVGFISPISNVFCSLCNRIRLTSTGKLKLCLHHDIGIDLRELLRSGCADDEIVEKMKQGIMLKPQEHQMMKDAEHTNMFQIGG